MPSEPEPAEQHLSLRTLLLRYRDNPDAWIGPLLEALRPWLRAAESRLWPVPPVIGPDDVHQMLVMRVLELAGRRLPQCDERWLARRLVEAAERWVRRRLSWSRRVDQVPLVDELVSPYTVGESDMPIFDELPLTPLERSLFVRTVLGGESLEEIAQELGYRPATLRQQMSRARRRVRSGKALPGFGEDTIPRFREALRARLAYTHGDGNSCAVPRSLGKSKGGEE